MPRRSKTTLAAAVMLTVIAGLTVARGTVQCAIPTFVNVPDFSGSSGNELAWEQPTDARQGGGFVIEVAYFDQRGAGGEFKSTVDGAVNVIYLRTDIHRSLRSLVVEPVDGLPEATLHYHIRAKSNAECQSELNPWSAPVTITQDYSAPEVTISARGLGAYVLSDVVVSGAAQDAPGDEAFVEAASGVDRVRLIMDSTTPLVGEHSDTQTVEVAEDGTWSATFEGVPLGTYQISATAFDEVGNRTEEPPTVSIVVVAP